jgi:hypothetical protein
MSDPETNNDDLARRLEWATRGTRPAAADAAGSANVSGQSPVDAEAAQWRESWVALSNHLEKESAALDTNALLAKLQAELAPAAPSTTAAPKKSAGGAGSAPRSAWWLAAAAALILAMAAGWWIVRQTLVTGGVDPNGTHVVDHPQNEVPQKKSAPEEKPLSPEVVEKVTPKEMSPEVPSSEELALTAWDDTEVEQALTQVQTQVYGAGSEWTESVRLNLLDQRLQELEEQMDDDSL